VADTLPKYRQIADRLAEDIAAGRLKAGDQIPPERSIAETYGASRMTVRQALRHLAERGIVQARAGAGTFVEARPIQQELSTLTGFTEEMERQGRRAESILVEAVPAAAESETAQALGLAPGDEVWRISRIRLADGAPVALETTEIAAGVTPGLLDRADFARASLYATLRAVYGIHPATAEQTLAAAAAEPSTALPLRLAPGAPVLRLTRLTREAEGRAFEYVRSVYRGDAFVMKARLDLADPAPPRPAAPSQSTGTA
jgi:GntR family transcriptional regulator